MPEDNGDFIMVVTVTGDVETLPLHQIERVQASLQPHPLAVVVMKGSHASHTLVIQETAEHFLDRCERLQTALFQRDLSGINRHLAPPL